MSFSTPLRYPGGKASLGPWLAEVLKTNAMEGGLYAEPYAGGAGAAIYLLANGHVERAIINDADPAIYAFWWSVLNETDRFISKLQRCVVSLAARQRHKNIIASPASHPILDVGFAAFFLNRTNHSGILQGGVIGGKEQSGNYKIYARFNKDELAQRVRRIGDLRRQIELHGDDASALMTKIKSSLSKRSLIYLDPPYFKKGPQLYRNYYSANDHQHIASRVKTLRTPWLVTYDDCDEIRSLYKDMQGLRFSLYYSTHSSRAVKTELMYFGNMSIPKAPYMKRASPGNFDTSSRLSL